MYSHFILGERCGRHRNFCSLIYMCTPYKSHYKVWQWLTTSRLVSGNTPVFWPTKLTAEKKVLLIMGRYTRELILFYCLLTIIGCKLSYPWCGLISVHLYPVTLHLLCLVDCKIHNFTEKGVYLRKQICNFYRAKIGIYDNDTNPSHLAKLIKEAK